MDYALWPTRALGYLIDLVIVGGFVGLFWAVGALLFGTFAGLAHSPDFADFADSPHFWGLFCMLLPLFLLASLAVGLFNKVYLVARRGASIGQGLVHIRVVDGQGKLLSLGNAFARLLVHLGLNFLPFGGVIDLLWPLWDERRQTLHDKAVGCYVINWR
jgi:uncharacterized RDD family membrane protein YckC